MGTGFTIALLVHAGLVAALAYGVAWRRQDVNTVSAELWAAVPQIAAPMAPPPPPPAPPAPAPRPVPAPPPPPPAPAQKADADIAVKKAQKEKDDKEKAARDEAERKKAALEKERAEKERAEKDKAVKIKAAQVKAAQEKAAQEKAAQEKAAQEKLDKAEAERVSKQRQENIARMNRELGNDNPAVGNNTGPSSGRAAVSAAPSATYAGRIRARVLPNIVYSGARDLSILAEVEVRVAPDGKIMGTRLVKSSGNPDWDQAVQRALTRTDVLPADTDGRIPPVMLLSFDPTQR
ncbi:cell division and transport-associated protein TolA [Sphaerotilus mobilis]|uniref:Cell division and transport-associated protein TolA n=2 Tax=Sphaerotilus mobilis TaxID=47994 RepID=A0A4Q7LVI7_9BURK|nr:cell division and transport-associated protein TolA [Sphaerotilus mobilis]